MKRYAVYFIPPAGAFARAAAAWLGYDVQTARDVTQPMIAGLPRPLAEVTADPRKYGFHGTIKAPFRLAEGVTPADLVAAVSGLAINLAPVGMAGLQLVNLDGFLAFVPEGDTTILNDLAAQVVRGLDPLRAGLTDAEIARRRPYLLTPRQRDLLDLYGYPFVLDEFRFHLTLSGPLPAQEYAIIAGAAATHFANVVPQPFVLADICLMGEDAAGRFHVLSRYPLTA